MGLHAMITIGLTFHLDHWIRELVRAANICFGQCFSVISCVSVIPTSLFQFFAHTTHTNKINDIFQYISLIFTWKLLTSLFDDYNVIGITWFITSSTLLLIFVESNKMPAFVQSCDSCVLFISVETH